MCELLNFNWVNFIALEYHTVLYVCCCTCSEEVLLFVWIASQNNKCNETFTNSLHSQQQIMFFAVNWVEESVVCPKPTTCIGQCVMNRRHLLRLPTVGLGQAGKLI